MSAIVPIELAPEAPRRSRRLQDSMLVLVAAAALIAIATAVFPWNGMGPLDRLRGTLALRVWVEHPSGMLEEVEPGAALPEGGALRFQISTGRAGFFGIVRLSASGTSVGYFPSDEGLLAFPAGRDQPLAGKVWLEPGAGSERLFLLRCPRRITIERAVKAGQRALDAAHRDPLAVHTVGVGCEEIERTFTKRGQ